MTKDQLPDIMTDEAMLGAVKDKLNGLPANDPWAARARVAIEQYELAEDWRLRATVGIVRSVIDPSPENFVRTEQALQVAKIFTNLGNRFARIITP